MHDTMSQIYSRYQSFLASVIEKYGKNSNACLIVRLGMLPMAIKCNIDENRIDILVKEIIGHYTLENTVPSSFVDAVAKRCDGNKQVVYAFSQLAFVERYGKIDVHIRDYLLDSNDPTLEKKIQDSMWYTFVITPDQRLVLFDCPMNVNELVLNGNRRLPTGIEVVHPLLAWDCSMEVIAAGEMCFVIFNDEIQAVIINTKSGHYCPTPDTVPIIESVLTKRFGSIKLYAIPVRLRN